jgi:hypothetical protein
MMQVRQAILLQPVQLLLPQQQVPIGLRLSMKRLFAYLLTEHQRHSLKIQYQPPLFQENSRFVQVQQKRTQPNLEIQIILG